MNKTLKVRGMHCPSCKVLIEVELEDAGLSDYVESVELPAEGEELGAVNFKNISQEGLDKAISTINAMDHYEVE